jgi:hypothetical protein
VFWWCFLLLKWTWFFQRAVEVLVPCCSGGANLVVFWQLYSFGGVLPTVGVSVLECVRGVQFQVAVQGFW